MPDNIPQMRASTTREKLYDYMQQFLGSIAEQPAARIAEPVLGIRGMQESQVMPFSPRSPEEMAMGSVMGSLSRGGNRGPTPGTPEWKSWLASDPESKALSGWDRSGAHRFNRDGQYVPSPGETRASPTEIRSMHPTLPPEFNVTRPSRTGPVDMNEMPPGKIEYLDPDVAEYMNPTRPDPTTIEGQRRLRFLMGQR